MNRVLVVPWSMAPTKSGIGFPRFDGGVQVSFGQAAGFGGLRRQEPPDEHLVEAGAHETTDDGRDDRDPEIQVPVLISHCSTVASDERGEPRAEVTGRVDRIAG